MSSPASDFGHRAGDAESVYHVELRQFPHNVCRFNLAEQELRAMVVERWAQDQWIEVGERKWSPYQAKLTVLQGPRLPLEQLSMGRGWRAAQRNGRDVTDRVLAAAREAVGDGGQAGAGSGSGAGQAGPDIGHASPPAVGGATPAFGGTAPTPGEDLVADSLGLELLSLLGTGRVPLRRSWELAGERHPQRTAGEWLTLAERAVASLLRARLIVLAWDDDVADDRRLTIGDEQIQAVLRSIDSWSGGQVEAGRAAPPVWMFRA